MSDTPRTDAILQTYNEHRKQAVRDVITFLFCRTGVRDDDKILSLCLDEKDIKAIKVRFGIDDE